MNRRIVRILIVLIVICLVVGAAVWLLRNKNELSQESLAAEVPCEGVFLDVTATKRDLEIVVSNAEMMNYIVWEPDQMELEMLVDGTWYVVRQDYVYPGEMEMLAPADEKCTLNYRWKDIYPSNLESGEYRLVFTFWAMAEDEAGTLYQTDNFVIIEEFVIK